MSRSKHEGSDSGQSTHSHSHTRFVPYSSSPPLPLNNNKEPPAKKSLSPKTTIPPQTFPLAHPPPKSKSQNKCLRLSSRLLLQIQQLHYSSTSQNAAPRAVPILELYHPSTFGKSVGARKAHSRDMYLVQSEPFAHLRRKQKPGVSNGAGNGDGNGNGVLNGNGSTNGTKPRSGSGTSRRKSKSSHEHESSGEDEDRERKVRFKKAPKEPKAEDDEEDVVAVIHTSPKPKTKGNEPAEAELYFPLSGAIWNATSPSPGQYRFKQDLEGNGLVGNNDAGVVFSWENRPPSPSSTATEKSDEGERFVLSVSGTTSSRRPWLAQLTRRGLHVGGMDAWQRELRALAIDDGADGAGLYTLIVTMGVWVARREGWVN
ncbi:hypothetical protein BJY00DRAFT_312194 [Aspergillus carlsbadensis]|nr:hypothetical protein BJY00DRAFT_312194 [Aspergillus carlsbadensis]